MKYRRKEALGFLLASLSLAAFFSYIGICQNQTTWKFDMAIIGAFLLGDYPLRWLYGLRKNRRALALIHFLQRIHLFPKPGPSPAWTKLGLDSAVFLLAVLLVGEAAFLVAIPAGVFSTQLKPFDIVLWSLVLSLMMATDFRDHYRKDMGAEDDFWANIPA